MESRAKPYPLSLIHILISDPPAFTTRTISPGAISPIFSAIFNVVVQHPDAQVAKNIAEKIGEIAPGEIVRVVKAGGSEIIDTPQVSNVSSSPLKKNIIIGFAAGLLISFVGFLLAFALDTKIRTAEDISKSFAYPILGEVPNLDISKGKMRPEK